MCAYSLDHITQNILGTLPFFRVPFVLTESRQRGPAVQAEPRSRDMCKCDNFNK